MKEDDFSTVFRYVRGASDDDYWSFLEWVVIARIHRCESTIYELETRWEEGDKEEKIERLLIDCREELAAFKELRAFVCRNKPE